MASSSSSTNAAYVIAASAAAAAAIEKCVRASEMTGWVASGSSSFACKCVWFHR